MHPPFRGAEPCCTRRLSPLVRVRVLCFRCKETRVSSVFEETRVFSVFEETRRFGVWAACCIEVQSPTVSLSAFYLSLSVCLSVFLSLCLLCVCVHRQAAKLLQLSEADLALALEQGERA